MICRLCTACDRAALKLRNVAILLPWLQEPLLGRGERLTIATQRQPFSKLPVFATVLIALNNSPSDNAIVEAAGNLVLAPQARVIMVHVLPYADDVAGQDASRPLPANHDFPHYDIEQHLSACAQRLVDSSPVIEVVPGEPDREIIRLANIYQVDLIVLGSRGLQGVNRIIEGSVSSQVLEQAPCTVMVVKPRGQGDRG
ncbi:universal stress protein [Nodosilinea sp. P-1105]|nr:universal stress protein [Nodosilinea sp. P-1105]NMF82827.1 universal stress protein [Nodosilinea sp. P-1105]